jgi:hypothetical protein
MSVKSRPVVNGYGPEINKNIRPNHDIKIDNRFFENVAQFKYLGTIVTNRNLIHEEIKSRLNSGNAS